MASAEKSDRKLTRKLNKPLMERKRRERFNICLDQLKTVLMDVTKKESSFYSKLEKADILEMTVEYMRNLKRRGAKCKSPSDEEKSTYISGFKKCIGEVTTYLSISPELDEDARISLINHLGKTLLRIQATTVPPGIHVLDLRPPSMTPSLIPRVQPYQQPASGRKTSNPEPNCGQEISSRSRVTSFPTGGVRCEENSSKVSAAIKDETQEVLLPPMKVVPAWLASGEPILLLTGCQTPIIPKMPCSKSCLINTGTASKSKVDTGNGESFSLDPTGVFASSDTCATPGTEPKTSDLMKADRRRIADSDNIVASPRNDTETDKTDRNDWRHKENEPEVAKLLTASDIWRPW